MGLKKYEIITVGSDKRVRALRSWQVGDRYVNIGDVGGIVYDEKTLSQDGACWLFRGNFGFPGARIGGDSIVDVAEATLSTAGTPNVDILGSSVVVGSKLSFAQDKTTEDAVVLTAADFEQGLLTFASGANWETWKSISVNHIRSKAPIFTGGASVTLKLSVPGYTVQAYGLDRDGNGVGVTSSTDTGAGVTLSIPAGQYFVLRMAKKPVGPTVPTDATTAQITFTGIYETKLSIIDSRVEINPATSTGTAVVKPGGFYAITSGANYPEAVIRNSKMSIIVPASANRSYALLGQIIESTATLDGTSENVTLAGIYSNIKNLIASGVLSSYEGVSAYNIIQATDCNDFAVSPTIFPGLAAARTANMPFIFQGCNVPNGRFYHHAQIANTYKNIDFALAQADLGKTIASGEILASSEVEGMYRAYLVLGTVFGGLVEGYDSVKSLNMAGTAGSYGTTIYKDAYVSGKFDFAGTNVFGNKVRSHPLAQVLNVQPRAVQGIFNTVVVGETITGVVTYASRVSVPVPFRINGSKGITINCPTGIEGAIVCTDINGVIKALTSLATGESSVTGARLVNTNAYLFFAKTGGTAITPEDLAGVTVTVYNGCKIVNTGETAVNMKGNIRVEDNATLVNASVVGSGYFGGNGVASGLIVNGCAFMDDNATFVKTGGAGAIRNLKMTDNATAVVGDVPMLGNIALYDNSVFMPTSFGNAEADVSMHDNATVTSSLSLGGKLTMRDNATVSAGQLLAVGDITLCGSYKQTATKSWTGKRVIFTETDPAYDNNVKTQYDF